MGGDGVKTDPESLGRMAAQLRDSTSGLDGAAKASPPMPSVTISSERVGHTLSEITRTVAGLLAGVEDTAGKIDASDGSYAEVDNEAGVQLQQQQSHFGPR